MTKRKRVAVLLPETFGYSEGVLRGIVAYAGSRTDWVTLWQDPEPHLLDKVAAWKPDGVVAHLYAKVQAEAILGLGVPVVNVSGNLHVPGVPRVSAENGAVAKMAAAFLAGRGYRHFACLSTRDRWYTKIREVAFVEELEARGLSCALFSDWYVSRANLHPERMNPYPKMREWMQGLVLPTALFAVQDTIGVAAIEMAHDVGLRVPEDISVLGVDNSETLCKLSNPKLSSIELPLEEIGARACELLQEILEGHAVSDEAVLLPPVRVVERRSTDTVAVEDGAVSEAVRFIRENAHRPITVDDVVREVMVSRRVLEQRFKKHLKRTPLDEIHEAHVAWAKGLLAETELSMPEVAERAGFTSAIHLSTLFRNRTGMTPTAYRRSVRGQRGAGKIGEGPRGR